MAMRAAIVALLCLAATANAAWQDADPVQITRARLRTVQDNYGQKLKLSYNWVNGASGTYELCVRCEFDDNGQRVGDAGVVRSGGTCGGPGNGCMSVKDLKFGEHVTVAIRHDTDDAPGVFGAWTAVSTYYIDPSVEKGQVVVIQSEEQKAAAKEEL